MIVHDIIENVNFHFNAKCCILKFMNMGRLYRGRQT